jgi:hypothetical protein
MVRVVAVNHERITDMHDVDLESTQVPERDSRLFASQQILPFLFVPKEYDDHGRYRAGKRAASKSLFSLEAIPPDAFTNDTELFRWKTRPIYDIDGVLLFRDQTLALGPGQELRVRTAASELLRSPVWSVRAGAAVNIDGLISKALSVVQAKGDLVPEMIGDEKTPRLICYAYPKLGILCRSKKNRDERFVIDLWELVQIPADVEYQDAPLEYVRTVWSPFDHVARGRRANLRARWRKNFAALPRLPKRFDTLEDLIQAIEEAGGSIRESRITSPELELERQATPYFCAAATAKMILDFYGIQTAGAELSQNTIYRAMGEGETGADPQRQADAIPGLSGNALMARLDVDPLFSEAADQIRAQRPFKAGTLGHARACGGFLIEGSCNGWFYIYDPYPENEGATYYEAFEIGYYINYMFVERIFNS